MTIVEITDLSLPELAPYAALTEAQLRSRQEPQLGLFIAESETVIRNAVRAGCEPLSLLMERRHLSGRGKELTSLCGDVPVYTADSAVLASLTGYSLTRGFLAAFRRPQSRSVEQVCGGGRRIAVLEGITDAANVGAAFRSAAALGVDAMLLSPTCCDPLNRKAMRVSMGTVLSLPWARLDAGWPRSGMERLHALGFRTAALALTDRSVSIDDPALKMEPRLALLLGTEGTGLLQETIDLSDYTVKIPMARGVDSLNGAAAGAVAFWELCRPGERKAP